MGQKESIPQAKEGEENGTIIQEVPFKKDTNDTKERNTLEIKTEPAKQSQQKQQQGSLVKDPIINSFVPLASDSRTKLKPQREKEPSQQEIKEKITLDIKSEVLKQPQQNILQPQKLKDEASNSQLQEISDSRLKLKQQREKDAQIINDQNEAVKKVLLVLQQNQDQLIEVLDERMQLVINNFDDKIATLENKMDEINDRLKGFESTIEDHLNNSSQSEAIQQLRNEVKQIVAISERHMKDSTKMNEIESLSVLHKSIMKDNKPTKRELHSKLSKIREKQKLDKSVQESQILREFEQQQCITLNNNNSSNLLFFENDENDICSGNRIGQSNLID